VDPFICRYVPTNLFWNQGRVQARDLEFTDIFYDVMANANYNVVGNPTKMFGRETDDAIEPVYVVGGQIEDIKMEICEQADFWTGIPLGTQSGKGAVKVRWQLFSTFERKVVFETTTQGAAEVSQGSAKGEMVILTEAFAEAAANLAADDKLVRFLSSAERSVANVRAASEIRIALKRATPYQQPITENIDRIRLGTVTIDSGTAGHGSGFFISPTLLLTNFHVVRNSQYVRITLITGRKILGEVVRRHPERDVALVQVEASGHVPIPIRNGPLKITEEVYAIGSPLDKKLSGTVTRGIVSKFATNRNGLEDIQADVDIQGGNSGGALLDVHGNVVGISYAGIGPPGKFSSGINFFIPIMDALDKLNLAFKSRAGD
jgi:S1-C subfamily serine protease